MHGYAMVLAWCAVVALCADVAVEPAGGSSLEGLPDCDAPNCVVEFAFRLWHAGHKPEAVKWLTISQPKFPDSTYVLTHLGLMSEEVEGKEAALAIHRRVVELDDGQMASAYEVGRLSTEAGDKNGAKSTFEFMLERLAEGNTDLPKTHVPMFTAMPHHHLGIIAAERMQTAAALQHFRQAFDSDPVGIYLAAHNLQIMNATEEVRADGSLVDLSIANSVEMNVKHPVSIDTTAHCPVCDGATVRAGAFFVEIGTSDFDTLAHRFYTEGFWSGVSVEPIASYLERLPTRPGFTKVNAVVSDVDGFQDLFMIPEETIKALGMPEMTKGLSSLIQDHSDVVNNPRLKEHFRPVKVPSVTLQTLSDHFQVDGVPQRIDLFHVDTEGFDAKIVHQVLDYGEQTCGYPRHIKMEWVHVSTEEQRVVLKRLAKSGYQCFFKAKDVQCTYSTCVGSGALMWRE